MIRDACAQKQFDQTAGNCDDPTDCQMVEVPTIEPCLHLRWGDGAKDQLETEDTEVLCITVCNPYSNVALNHFTMQLTLVKGSGNAVPTLPDGTPSVLIKPSYMICFDDIPPCDPAKPEQSCVSREVVLITRGAKVGTYSIWIVYCFDACFTTFNCKASFTLDLVAS